MPDLSQYRTEILVRGKKRSIDSERPLVRSGWFIVNYGTGEMREPADRIVNEFYATEKEVTGFVILDPEDLGTGKSVTGGNVERPTA